MFLTRPPRERTEVHPVRLACIRHAASVDPEPGSNSPPNAASSCRSAHVSAPTSDASCCCVCDARRSARPRRPRPSRTRLAVAATRSVALLRLPHPTAPSPPVHPCQGAALPGMRTPHGVRGAAQAPTGSPVASVLSRRPRLSPAPSSVPGPPRQDPESTRPSPHRQAPSPVRLLVSWGPPDHSDGAIPVPRAGWLSYPIPRAPSRIAPCPWAAAGSARAPAPPLPARASSARRPPV